MTRNIKTDDLVRELQAAARAARVAGDTLTALALEQSIEDLKIDVPMFSAAISGLTFGTSKSRDLELDMAKWSLLKPRAIHATEPASIIDCGQRGRITIIGGSILIKGSIAMDPMTALLIADHAKRNHNGQGTAFGSREFLRNIAVANAATGTAIHGPQIAAEGQAAIQQAARGWQPMLTAIRSASPTRPAAPSVQAPSITLTPEPVA